MQRGQARCILKKLNENRLVNLAEVQTSKTKTSQRAELREGFTEIRQRHIGKEFQIEYP